jgi:hypothetical protein
MEESFRGARKWLKEAAVRRPIRAEAARGLRERVPDDDRRLAVERVGHGSRPSHPLQAMVPEWQRGEVWRQAAEWMCPRADVVREARERERRGARASADLVLPLENEHGDTVAAQFHSG